jgi:3-oxoacyl-[acyl-carrier protein] reductase
MDKRVLVTGCTRGIGEAVAQLYKSHGAFVIGTGTKLNTPAYADRYIDCDFNDDDSLDQFCTELSTLDIDIVVNNAGINIIDEFVNIHPEDFLKIQQVNVFAPLRICQAVLPHMAQAGWGRIVNISSVWGKISKANRASYSASKFAIDGMTLALANEYACTGVLANCVAPGFIDTDMTWQNLGSEGVAKMIQNIPIGRLADVTEIAKFVCWLGSQENTYISGQNIAIDGGFTRA